MFSFSNIKLKDYIFLIIRMSNQKNIMFNLTTLIGHYNVKTLSTSNLPLNI